MSQSLEEWLASLRARASQSPARARMPLRHGEFAIGSIDPQLWKEIDLLPPCLLNSLLYKSEYSDLACIQINSSHADLTHTLAMIAGDLRAQRIGQVAQHWRDEQLAVHDAMGQAVATVERAAVRLLGIATQAVHLVGCTPTGDYWIQQRSLSKANDPGLLDTLMGGLVSAKDTLSSALERETWEEAGLKLSDLGAVQVGGQVLVQRPTGEDDRGYMIEDTVWYHCTVPDGLTPVNQDGEVAQFLCLSPAEVVQRLQDHAFTLEAALVLAAAMEL
jgi:8-oxo-dGTP pyrophosphatase MutT (NUDIX family)